MRNDPLSTIGRVLSATAIIAIASIASAQDADDPYRPLDRPLDPRINPEKITEQAPPALPEQVLLPLPPDHRIATNASEVPISAAHWEKARQALAKGIAFLLSQQDESGAWMAGGEAAPTNDPNAPSPIAMAITAMSIKAIVQVGDDPEVVAPLREALRYLHAARKADGTFEAGGLGNYVASTVVSALASVARSISRQCRTVSTIRRTLFPAWLA